MALQINSNLVQPINNEEHQECTSLQILEILYSIKLKYMMYVGPYASVL